MAGMICDNAGENQEIARETSCPAVEIRDTDEEVLDTTGEQCPTEEVSITAAEAQNTAVPVQNTAVTVRPYVAVSHYEESGSKSLTCFVRLADCRREMSELGLLRSSSGSEEEGEETDESSNNHEQVGGYPFR